VIFNELKLKGAYLIKTEKFQDERGGFVNQFRKNEFEQYGLTLDVHQSSISENYKKGTVRGLHFQKDPHSEIKLVFCLKGSFFDVIVDMRKDSPTYGKCFSIELSEENKLQLLIPRGFAHGYSVISAEAVVFYKCDNIYMPSADGGIIFDDRELAIDWKIAENERIVSAKDKVNPTFEQYKLENL